MVAQRLAIVKRRHAHKKVLDMFIRAAIEYLGEEAGTVLLEGQEDPDSDNEGNDDADERLGEPAVSVTDPER